MVEKVKDDIVEVVKNDLNVDPGVLDSVWKSTLTDKVWEAEHNLIVFNRRSFDDPEKDAKDFIEKQLQLNEESLNKIKIRRSFRLGKGRNNQHPPLLISFSHPSDRNLVLSHSKNLRGKEYRIEKDAPKLYKKMFGQFKEEAWKLREHFGYQTQIVFNGHLMVLQYKKKGTEDDAFHYIVHKEWYPPPSEASSLSKNTLPVPPGTRATPPINPEEKKMAECRVCVSEVDVEVNVD